MTLTLVLTLTRCTPRMTNPEPKLKPNSEPNPHPNPSRNPNQVHAEDEDGVRRPQFVFGLNAEVSLPASPCPPRRHLMLPVQCVAACPRQLKTPKV